MRALTKGEADRLEAEAKAKAAVKWDAAAARGPAAIVISGALQRNTPDRTINCIFDCIQGERKPGGAPVYRRRGKAFGREVWLFRTREGVWSIGMARGPS